jgi:hypothetical protein
VKTIIALLLTLSIIGCSGPSETKIVMQAEVADYMHGDNDSAGRDRWMHEGTAVRALAFQIGCSNKHWADDCRTKLEDFDY